MTYSKKDLKKGEILDGVGGFTTYGMIELYGTAKDEDLLPLGLSEGCRLKNNIEKGSPITYKDVELVQDSTILQLRRLQDKTVFLKEHVMAKYA